MTASRTHRQTAPVLFVDAVPTPSEITDLVDRVQINWSANHEDLPAPTEAALRTLVADLRRRGIALQFVVLVRQDNWIHVPAWVRRARDLQAVLTLNFVAPPRAESLASLDGHALSFLRSTIARWMRDGFDATETQAAAARTAVAPLGQWQREAAARPAPQGHLTLPGPRHSLVSSEAALEPLLIDLLRVHDRPEIEPWLLDIVRTDGFATTARERRSFRLAALWLYGVFRRVDILPILAALFETPEHARDLLQQDAAALAQTPIGSWLDGWRQQLRLVTVHPRDTPFPKGVADAPAIDPPRITVVIPSFNHELFVSEAIRSVLAQTRGDIQLLVVDDGSTDGTVAAARGVTDARVRVVENERNLGLGRSLARALDSVSTECVAVLNSDDVFHPERLDRCLRALDASPTGTLVATGLLPIDASGRVFAPGGASPVFEGLRVAEWLDWYWRSAPPEPPPNLLLALLERNFLITSSNLVARTEFLRRHRHLWEPLEFCLDWQLFLLAAMDDTLVVVPDALLGYRLHQTNTVWFDETRGGRYYVEANRVAARVLDELARRPPVSESPRRLLEAMAEHLALNTNADWAAILLNELLDQRAKVTGAPAIAHYPQLTALTRTHAARVERDQWLRDLNLDLREVAAMRGELPYLRQLRNQYEPLVDEHERLRRDYEQLRSEYARLDADTAEFRSRSVRAEYLIANMEASALGAWLLNSVRLRTPLLAVHRMWLAWRNGS